MIIDRTQSYVQQHPRQVGKDIWWLLLAFFGSRLFLEIVGLLQRKYQLFLIPSAGGWTYLDKPWLGIWVGWDSGLYRGIAERGYPPIEAAPGIPPYGFFPLFPYLASSLSSVFGDTLLAGVVLSNAAFVLAGLALRRLIAIDFGETVAFRTAILFFLNPFSFYGSCFLSEGVFSFLLIAAFLCARVDRAAWCILFASLLPVARPIGTLLFLLPIVCLAWRRYSAMSARAGLVTLGAAAGSLPLLVHIFHVHALTGEWLKIFTVHREWNRFSSQGVLASFVDYTLVHGAAAWYEIGIAVGAIVLFTWMRYLFRRRSGRSFNIEYVVLGWVSMLVPVLSGIPQSFPRYLVPNFPVFTAAATARLTEREFILCCLLSQFLGAVLFVFWVAQYRGTW